MSGAGPISPISMLWVTALATGNSLSLPSVKARWLRKTCAVTMSCSASDPFLVRSTRMQKLPVQALPSTPNANRVLLVRASLADVENRSCSLPCAAQSGVAGRFDEVKDAVDNCCWIEFELAQVAGEVVCSARGARLESLDQVILSSRLSPQPSGTFVPVHKSPPRGNRTHNDQHV